jgi:serine protease Do
MSPQGSGEVAGVEWYDSGIGFAAPLETVMKVLPKWREGHDLDAGLLGVSMQSADIFSQPAVLAAVRASAPAYKAGLRAGDKIVEANGRPITRQAELKHQLGPRYAGEKVKIVAVRGEERLEREIELADKIEPYEHPFLGVLPRRPRATDKRGGVAIRFVYPDSPAAKAGLQAGDLIRSLGDKPLESITAMLEQFQALVPGEKVKLEFERAGQSSTVEATLGRLPEVIPAELPPARDPKQPDADKPKDEIKRGVISVKVPEFEQECVAYVPESYRTDASCGLLVWLHGPGGLKETELVELWKPLCEEHGLILLAPKATDRDRWEPTEARFIRRAMDEMLKDYSIDRARVVVHGYQGGAAMAYLVGATSRDIVRGVAAIDTPLPRVPLGETDPVQRLAFLVGYATKTDTTPAVQAGIARLRALKFSVSEMQLGEQARYLTAEELDQLVRWMDSLDRF